MDIRYVRRWAWMLAGVIAGALVAEIQRMPSGNWAREHADAIAQHEFESAVVREFQGVRHFTGLTVYPRQVADVDGQPRTLHIVAGRHYDGKPRQIDGQMRAVWQPRCFVAEVPYWSAGTQHPTVMAWLDTQASRGVRYRYAWWQEPRWMRTVWISAGFVAVGLIWPTALYLCVFGRWWNPPREGPDLAALKGVHGTSGTAATAPADLSAAADYAAQVEAELAASDAPSPAPAPPGPAQQPVRPLSNQPPEASAPLNEQEAKAFGARSDDFYPTELGGQADKPGSDARKQ